MITPPGGAPAAMSTLINAYSTVRALPAPGFRHDLHGQRDRGNPELVAHLDGFVGYVMDRGGDDMTAAKYHVMRHLQRVRHHLSMTVGDADLPAFGQWATAANALCFLPDGSVRDPAGRILISADGQTDAEAEVPCPSDARVRKARTDEQLARLSVHVPAHLPAVISELEVELRNPAEVALRALALFVVALRAESLGTGDEITVPQLRDRLPQAFTALSPAEAEFLDAPAPTTQQITNFGWRYEALSVLQFALGMIPALPFPSAICDVGNTAKLMLDTTAEQLVSGAHLQHADGLLQTLDLHYRLHWAVRQADLDSRDPEAGLDGGVVQERHHALNWLVRFEDADWDDVDTPT